MALWRIWTGELSDIGLSMTGFQINSVSYPEEVQEMINKVASQSMVGDMNRYQQMAVLDSMTAGNAQGGQMAADMASMQMGMMMGTADRKSDDPDAAGRRRAEPFPALTSARTADRKRAGANFCPNCGQKIKVTAQQKGSLMSIYDTLNKEQREAVFCTEGPLLMLAGAGTGKTRSLTHRIVHLIEEGVNPWNILAITFTNKAAEEMRERAVSLVGPGSENLWISTFHATCSRILRRHADLLGYNRSFTIYDASDQKSLMKEVLKSMNVDTKQFPEKAVLSAISAAKDECKSPLDYRNDCGDNYRDIRISEIYEEYQKRLKENDAMDFDDLLVKTVELFQSYPDVLDYYQERFRYIMVDEYQDTNTVQFMLVKLLASKYRNLCVVGDDDQSIYRFRGANIFNILNFEKYFPDAHVIRLEQNYRSTQNILNAANGVIVNNKGRKEKKLWTENVPGELVHFKQYDSEYDEAEGVVSYINFLAMRGVPYEDMAILYRTNAQSPYL